MADVTWTEIPVDKKDDVTWTEVDDSAIESAHEKPWYDISAKGLARGAIDAIPTMGAIGGGVMGAALGPVTAVGGAGLGYAAGDELAGVLRNRLLGDEAPSVDPTEQVKRVAGSVRDGAMMEMGGQALGAGLTAADKARLYMQSKVAKGSGNLAKRFGARAIGAERATVKKLGPQGVEELGDYALKNKLLSPMGSTDDILSRNEAVMSKAMDQRSQAYKTIDEAGASPFNPLEAATRVEDDVVGGLNRAYDDTKEIAQALDPHLSNILSRGDQNISMQEAQKLVESLGKKAKFDTSRSNVSNDTAVDAYFAARNYLNEAAGRGADSVGVTGLKDIIEGANKTYSTGLKAKGLLDNKFAREQGNKLIGLTDTITGAEALGALGGPKTAAVMAVKRGAERYGSQNAALGLDKLSRFLRQSPRFEQMAQKNPRAFSAMVADFAKKSGAEAPKAAQFDPSQPQDDQQAREAFLDQ